MSTERSVHAEAMGSDDDICPMMPNYAAPTVMFVRGEGSRLWDDRGDEYLDLLAGIAVTSIGHCHPAVAAAVSEQSRKLVHVSNLFGTEHNAVVARTLDRLLGGGGQVFFANSGAEANEAAIKLARRFGGRGRHVVVSAFGQLPRPNAGNAARDRTTGEARDLPTPSRGVPPRRLDGPHGPGTTARRHRGGGAARSRAGRGRGELATTEYLGAVRSHVRRARRSC